MTANKLATEFVPARAALRPWWWSIAQGLALVWALGTAASLVCLLRGFVRLAVFCRGLHHLSRDDAGPRSKVGWDSVPTHSGQSPKLQVAGEPALAEHAAGDVRQAAAQAAAQVGLAYVVDDEYILITAPQKDAPAKALDQIRASSGANSSPKVEAGPPAASATDR